MTHQGPRGRPPRAARDQTASGGLAAEWIFLIIFYVTIYSSGLPLKTQWSEGLRTKGLPLSPQLPRAVCSWAESRSGEDGRRTRSKQ